jgi:hypothetical protein
MTSVKPAWGLAHVVPEDAIAAWGARLIVTQQGAVDSLPDRMGSDGGGQSAVLMATLNARFPFAQLRETVSTLLKGFRVREGDRMGKIQMRTREPEDFILYMDDRVVVHANTNGSAGYCYVTAWLYEEDTSDEDDGVSRWCEDCGHLLDKAGMCPSCIPVSQRSAEERQR